MKNTTIILTDTFNSRKLSNHRTVRAAVIAQRKHLAKIKKTNGSSSYLTYSIKASDGADIFDEVMAERMSIDSI